MPGRKKLCGYGTDFDCDQWLSLEISGVLGSLLSWGVHIFALATLWSFQNSVTTSLILMLLYLPCSALAMVSLAKATLTDPGAVPKAAQPFVRVRKSGDRVQRAVRRCHKCEAYKPDRAHHDSVTGRCIVKFDHFCPWVGNAVGALNHKFFCLFLFYTAICCLLSLVFLFIRLLNCGYVKDSSDDGEVPIDTEPHRLLSQYSDSSCYTFMKSRQVLALTIASLVFLVFTLVMLVDQIDAISTGKGKIARMKQQVGKSGTQFNTVTTEFNEMFGGNSLNVSWHWFLPISVRFPRGMKQVVLGYDMRPPDLESGQVIGSNEEEESPLHRRNSQSEEEIGISMVERATFT